MIFNTPENLLNQRINLTLVGAGGTGGYLLSLLAQMNYCLEKISNNTCGIDVTLFDPDLVSEFNCGRQNYYPSDIGFNKAEILINRVNFGFNTQWKAIPHYFDITKASNMQSQDILMTCVDKASVRHDIGQHWESRSNQTLWIDGGNGKSSGQVICGNLGDPRGYDKLPNVYDLYKDHLASMEDDETESCSHSESIRKQDLGVNHQTALIMSQILWQLLRHGGTKYHGSFFDLRDGDTTTLLPDEDIWKSFGYTPSTA